MNKFKDITLLHLDGADFNGEVPNEEATRASETADTGVYGSRVVKDRTAEVNTGKNIPDPETFKGIFLSSDCFAFNTWCLLKAAILLQMSDDESIKSTGGEILDFTRDYAEAAHLASMENQQ